MPAPTAVAPRPAGRIALIAFAAATGAVFLLSLADWERTSTAALRLRVSLLLLAPALSLVAGQAARRLDERARRRIAALLGAGIVGFAATEPLLALVWFGRAADHLPVDYRDKLQAVADLQASGPAAVPSIEPKALLQPADGSMRAATSDRGRELQVLGGVSHRPTVVCNETGEWITYLSDRYGMNNPDLVWDLSSVPIGVVGDAFANGWCIDEQQHFIGLLRRGRGPLANLAQSGNGPLLALAGIVEYFEELRPATVLWFYYELNDLDDLETELRSPLLTRYLRGGFKQALTGRQDAVDREVVRYINDASPAWRRYGNLQVGDVELSAAPAFLHDMLTMPRARRFWGLTYTNSDVRPNVEALQGALRRARDVVGAWQGDLQIVYLPAAARYLTLAGSGGHFEVGRRHILDIAARLGIAVVDVHEAFAARGRPLTLFNPIAGGDYGHYTPEGHRIVAAAVLEALPGEQKPP